MTINDEFALGALAGLVAMIPQVIFDFISVQLNYSKHYAFQISSSIYLYEPLTQRPLGLIFGGLLWAIMSIILGVITVYLLRSSGKDFWWLKGLAISNFFMFVIIYGFLYTLGAATIIPFDIPTNITIFIGNIIFGITVSYLITSWGGEKLPAT
ncbi:hypothetical protein [Natroniella sp. ANB-PHB2]|uniref:hypothetical protein n=1 Tax=Natroniella sp. ANB-PHB2 TaxID=3384444 RepID=UPI0038D35CDF